MNKYGLHQIELDIVEGCNLQCDFCGLKGMEKGVHCMSIETVEKICSLVKAEGLNLRMHLIGHGEPTLNKNLVQIIKTIKTILPKCKRTLTTNGWSIINSEDPLSKIQEYFDAGLDTLTIDEYLHNDLSMLKMYLYNKNVPFSENITDSFNPKAEKIRINPPIETNSIRCLSTRCGAALDPEGITPINKKCSKIFRELFIRWDGNIGLCCEDFRGEYGIENIHNLNSLEQVWNHPRLESARRLLYQGKRCFTPCNLCNVAPNRPGLLPDWSGKGTMPEPTEKDYSIAQYKTEPLSKIRKRKWEET